MAWNFWTLTRASSAPRSLIVHSHRRSAVELSTVRPEQPIFLPRSVRYAVGVDLGQLSDPTAIAVLQHSRGVLDSNSEYERHTCQNDIPQVPAEYIDVRHL